VVLEEGVGLVAGLGGAAEGAQGLDAQAQAVLDQLAGGELAGVALEGAEGPGGVAGGSSRSARRCDQGSRRSNTLSSARGGVASWP
jgi:hypothetical protein